jgi:phage-related protein
MVVVTHKAVDIFINDLEPLEYVKTLDGISLLKTFGRLLAPPHSKKIGKGLFELRIRADVHVRLLYGFWDNKAFIVHGFIKKTEKLSPQDLKLAKRRLAGLA